MQATMETTEKRRAKQIKYNEEHNIVPKTIQRNRNVSVFANEIENKILDSEKQLSLTKPSKPEKEIHLILDAKELDKLIRSKHKAMNNAVKELDFILAAQLRDEIEQLKKQGDNIRK